MKQNSMTKLTKPELSAVVAHECAHIMHKDVVRSVHLIAMVCGFSAIYRFGSDLMRELDYIDNKKQRNVK